jgi:hypothetical protein
MGVALQTDLFVDSVTEITMSRLTKHWKEVSCLIASIGLCDIGVALGGGPGGQQGGGAQNNTNQINFNGPVNVSPGNNIIKNVSPPGDSQQSSFTNQGSVNSSSSGGTQNFVGAQQKTGPWIIQGGYVKSYLNVQKNH